MKQTLLCPNCGRAFPKPAELQFACPQCNEELLFSANKVFIAKPNEAYFKNSKPKSDSPFVQTRQAFSDERRLKSLILSNQRVKEQIRAGRIALMGGFFLICFGGFFSFVGLGGFAFAGESALNWIGLAFGIAVTLLGGFIAIWAGLAVHTWDREEKSLEVELQKNGKDKVVYPQNC